MSSYYWQVEGKEYHVRGLSFCDCYDSAPGMTVYLQGLAKVIPEMWSCCSIKLQQRATDHEYWSLSFEGWPKSKTAKSIVDCWKYALKAYLRAALKCLKLPLQVVRLILSQTEPAQCLQRTISSQLPGVWLMQLASKPRAGQAVWNHGTSWDAQLAAPLTMQVSLQVMETWPYLLPSPRRMGPFHTTPLWSISFRLHLGIFDWNGVSSVSFHPFSEKVAAV